MKVLRAFFAREKGFFLSGGGALAGFYLGHRPTDDLDFFTADRLAFERGRYVLSDVARAIGAQIDVRQDTPAFQRFVLSAEEGGLVVDLVCDQTFQLRPNKPELDGIRVDPPEEILANKLTALVGRAEERDLVDVLFLERAGWRVEEALTAALQKDGGCTPATLAWILSEMEVADSVKLPGGVSPAEMRIFINDLIRRLRLAALPGVKSADPRAQ